MIPHNSSQFNNFRSETKTSGNHGTTKASRDESKQEKRYADNIYVRMEIRGREAVCTSNGGFVIIVMGGGTAKARSGNRKIDAGDGEIDSQSRIDEKKRAA